MLVFNWLLFCPIQLARDTFFILTVSSNFIDEAIWENKGVESIWCVTLQLKVSIYTKHSLGWSQYSKVTYLTPRKTKYFHSTVTSKNDQNLCCYFHLEQESIIGNGWAWFLFRCSYRCLRTPSAILCSHVSFGITDWNDDTAWQYNWDDINSLTTLRCNT